MISFKKSVFVLASLVLLLSACEKKQALSKVEKISKEMLEASTSKTVRLTNIKMKKLADRDPVVAHRLIDQEKGILLDVRSQAEFNAGHLPGAILIPVQELEKRMGELKKQSEGMKRPVVVYCRSGARAGVAKNMLKKAGFTTVVNLGAMSAY